MTSVKDIFGTQGPNISFPHNFTKKYFFKTSSCFWFSSTRSLQRSWFSSWTNDFAWMSSDMTYITSFLYIPRFAVSLLTIISSTYFTCLSDRNDLFLIGKEFSYVIGFLPILCKKMNNFCLGTGSKRNSKQASPHCTPTAGYRLFTKYFFSLCQFSSVHQKIIYFFLPVSPLQP